MNMSAVEVEMTRLLVWYLALSALAFAGTMWVLYVVIRLAIRDGIRDSGLVDTWRTTARRAQDRTAADTLPPDMSARR